jgi:hypothetical protein
MAVNCNAARLPCLLYPSGVVFDSGLNEAPRYGLYQIGEV